MSFRQLYRSLQRELAIINENTHTRNVAKDLERKTALLQYKRLQNSREGKSIQEVEKQLEQLNKNKPEVPSLDNTFIKEIVQEDSESELPYIKLNNLSNITAFLRSQRTYTELLERYNPGLTMSQEENVRRTANRVGLFVPENEKK
ncbi:uncharacterized protein PRCAT00004817001 [Priceomyces carsonii]|uniref:uncharacterized protein n=1 Tax=Priceomyces carsonii TaxID=28549 RepID=UPI002EDB26F0|nr:unnamed protein product [Priceomyces carsonii]